MVELYRKFVGFIQSWKKYSETEEGKLFGTFLQRGRNDRSSVRLFLRLRKILLKNINQKILKDISLSHGTPWAIIQKTLSPSFTPSTWSPPPNANCWSRRSTSTSSPKT